MTKQQDSTTKRVAILIENHVEDSEFSVPYNALRAAGAEVTVLGSRVNEKYQGKQMKLALEADRFVQDAVEGGKLVAAICHGPQVLIEGDLLQGKRATGFRAIRKDMQNAGANFEDAPVVRDGNLFTSRRPGDAP